MWLASHAPTKVHVSAHGDGIIGCRQSHALPGPSPRPCEEGPHTPGLNTSTGPPSSLESRSPTRPAVEHRHLHALPAVATTPGALAPHRVSEVRGIHDQMVHLEGLSLEPDGTGGGGDGRRSGGRNQDRRLTGRASYLWSADLIGGARTGSDVRTVRGGALDPLKTEVLACRRRV